MTEQTDRPTVSQRQTDIVLTTTNGWFRQVMERELQAFRRCVAIAVLEEALDAERLRDELRRRVRAGPAAAAALRGRWVPQVS